MAEVGHNLFFIVDDDGKLLGTHARSRACMLKATRANKQCIIRAFIADLASLIEGLAGKITGILGNGGVKAAHGLTAVDRQFEFCRNVALVNSGQISHQVKEKLSCTDSIESLLLLQLHRAKIES